MFVSAVDPYKEPPLVTSNTILSILATNYHVENLPGYLSNDGGSLLTFEALTKDARFSKILVPFCRKRRIKPHNHIFSLDKHM